MTRAATTKAPTHSGAVYALLKTMRRRKPMVVIEEQSPTDSSQGGKDSNYRLESPDRKELSP